MVELHVLPKREGDICKNCAREQNREAEVNVVRMYFLISRSCSQFLMKCLLTSVLIVVIPKRHVRVFEMSSSCCLCQLRCLQRVTGGVRLGTEAGLVPWGGFWWGWLPPGQGCCCACRWEAQDSSLGLRCLWFAERCGDLSLPRLCRSHCIVQGSRAAVLLLNLYVCPKLRSVLPPMLCGSSCSSSGNMQCFQPSQ